MLVIATRFYDQTDPKRIQVLVDFINSARKCASFIFVAVHSDADITNALEVVEELRIPGVSAFPVTPWNHPTGPLNALVLKAGMLWADQILFVSVEVKLTPEIVDDLVFELRDKDVLVVGAALEGHHLWSTGGHQIVDNFHIVGNGVTVPWNTCALWRLKYLTQFGFPLVANACFDSTQAGNEELATIAMYQRLMPNLKAILKGVPKIKWDTSGFSGERRSLHELKMTTKVERAAAQMKNLGMLPNPLVIHK